MFCGWSIASIQTQSIVGKELVYSAKLLGKCRRYAEQDIPRPCSLSIHNAKDALPKRWIFADSWAFRNPVEPSPFINSIIDYQNKKAPFWIDFRFNRDSLTDLSSLGRVKRAAVSNRMAISPPFSSRQFFPARPRTPFRQTMRQDRHLDLTGPILL